MSRVLLVCAIVAAAARAGLAAETAASVERQFAERVKPLLTKYCGDCHFDGADKGDLSLDRFASLASVQGERVVWNKVADNVIARTMPPAKKKTQPTDAERKAIDDWVKLALDYTDPTAPRDPGRVTIRRLNRNEYNNTIRDLLGVRHFQPADDFPADDTGYGFDNIGDVLSVSPLLIEKYLAAAEKALDKALATEPPPPPQLARFDGSQLKGDGKGQPRVFAENGEATRRVGFAATGRYVVRVYAAADEAGRDPARMALRVNGKDVATIDIKSHSSRTRPYEATFDIDKPDRLRVGVAFVNDYYDDKAPEGKRDRNLIVERVEVLGPIEPVTPGQQLRTRRNVLFVGPGQTGITEVEAATKVLERFASRAYRRPAASEEVAKLVALFKSARADGDDYEHSIRLALSAALVSPNFLFKIEQERSSDPDKPYFIDDYELATRLSYFLWSSMPDDALLADAGSGRLREPGVLRAQVRRMLADAKASALVENFVGQWLVMRNLEHHSVATDRYKDFNEQMRADMRREVEMFFANLIREDRSVLDLLDADYTFANERLAQLYDIKGVTGDDFRRVSLAGTPRGGVLTMAGVLTVTAMPARTSPVKRGKFILEQLLASPPPPQPPDVPALREQRRGDVARATVRERLEEHRANPSCVACHARMDPLGFALENFDAIGRWRDDERGLKIDASGSLPEGEHFTGPVELRKVLLERKDEFVRCLVEKLMIYALGRGMENYDRPAVKEIAGAVAKDGYKFSTLVDQIVASDAFQKRRAKRPG